MDSPEVPFLMEDPTLEFDDRVASKGIMVEPSKGCMVEASGLDFVVVAFAQTALGFTEAFVQITLMVEDLHLTKDAPKQ